MQLTKDGKNIKRAAHTLVLLRIHDKQHSIPATKAMARSNVPLRMTRVYSGMAAGSIVHKARNRLTSKPIEPVIIHDDGQRRISLVGEPWRTNPG